MKKRDGNLKKKREYEMANMERIMEPKRDYYRNDRKKYCREYLDKPVSYARKYYRRRKGE